MNYNSPTIEKINDCNEIFKNLILYFGVFLFILFLEKYYRKYSKLLIPKKRVFKKPKTHLNRLMDIIQQMEELNIDPKEYDFNSILEISSNENQSDQE
jgi:hypothetical protein